MEVILSKVLLFLLILRLTKCAFYLDPVPDPFPSPMTDNRTAIIISGQVRSANITFLSNNIHVHNFGKTKFGSKDPPTPLKSVIDKLIMPLAKYGGVDLFIYTPILTNSTLQGVWDGNPLTFEQFIRPGDTRFCRLYSESPIFDINTGNNVFCLTENEKKLTDRFINKFAYWNKYSQFETPNSKEMLLQQEYGKFRGNLAAQEQELLTGRKYSYKVRLRPDIAMIAAMPPIETFIFKNTSVSCPYGNIYYPNSTVFGYSAIDSFNIGEASDMNKLFNRYLYMITEKLEPMWRITHQEWNSERHLRQMLKEMFRICMLPHYQLLATKIRRNNHSRPSSEIPKSDPDWTLLSRGRKPQTSWGKL